MSTSNYISSNYAKGEDYFLSHITTLDRVETKSYPWVYSYFYKRFVELKIIRDFRNTCSKSPLFFMLIIWTLAVVSLVIFLLLPENVFVLFNTTIYSLISFAAPNLVCFIIYLWTGLTLKFYNLKFAVRKCFISCVILEVLIEIFMKSGLTDFSKSTVIGLTLSFIVMSTGICVLDKKYFAISGVISSIIMLRFVVVENASFFYKNSCPPLLTYISVITGLVVSTLPTLHIPCFNDEGSGQKVFEMSTIPIIRQRRASSVEIPSIGQNGSSHLQKARRKSLPVLGMPARLYVMEKLRFLREDSYKSRKLSLPMKRANLRRGSYIRGTVDAIEETTWKKVSMTSMDLTILGEAHGMISDLLADSSLPMNVTGTLRIVADMISPLLQHSFQRNQLVPTAQQLLTVYEKHKEDEQQVINQPDLKDDTPLSLKQRLQRNLGASSRRMSSSYTTTTSATGMPTIDMEYHSKKGNLGSKSIAKRNSHRSKSYAGVLSSSERTKAFANKSHSFSQTHSESNSKSLRSPKISESRGEDDIFKVEITRGKPVYFEGMDSDVDTTDEAIFINENLDTMTEKETTIKNTSQLEFDNDCLDKRKLMKRLSNLSETAEDSMPFIDKEIEDILSNVDRSSKPIMLVENNLIRRKDNAEEKDRNCIALTAVDTDNTSESSFQIPDASAPPLAHRKENRNIAEVSPLPKAFKQETCLTPKESLVVPHSQRRRSSRELHLEYETAVSHDVDVFLVKLNEWDFPIFELSEKCNVLTQLAFRIFQICGFFSTFKIPEITFLKYFRALESGYHNIPYHNRIHAADVLHAVYFLTQHKIPGFDSRTSSQQSCHDDTLQIEEGELIEEEYSYGCISDSMPELELMALYTAAAMHDFDHPGRTNAFLVATLNPKALLYNDRSVLENHHAAASWSLLVTNPSLNFLSGLDSVEFKRFRFIVIEEILSTDLKKHFDFLTEWNAKISGDGLNFTNEADRLLVGQMALKLADISGPSKEWDLHCRWTDRIIEEFYQQGEDEKTLEMPPSAYMDRDDPKVPQLQASFIKHLVSPLYMAYEKAGIMPGEWMETAEEEEEGEDESVTDGDGSDNEKDSSTKQKKITFSVVIDNIQKNHEKWLKIIEEEERDELSLQDEDSNKNGEEAEVTGG